MREGVYKNAKRNGISGQTKVKKALAELNNLINDKSLEVGDRGSLEDFSIDELKNFDGVKIEIEDGDEGISFKTARYLLKKVSDSEEQEKYSGLLKALFDSVQSKIAFMDSSISEDNQELKDIIGFISDIKKCNLEVGNINNSQINWFDDIAQLFGDQELKKFTARTFAKLGEQQDIEKLNRYIIDKTIDLDNDGITLNQLLSASKEWQRPQVIVAVIQAYAPNAKTIEEVMNSKVFEESINNTGDNNQVYIPKEEFARCTLKYLAKKEPKLNENELSLAKSAIASIHNFEVGNFNAVASAIEKHDDIYEQNKNDLNRMRIDQVRFDKLDKDSELSNISNRLKGNYELAKKILSLTNVKGSNDFSKIVYNMLPSDPKNTSEMIKSIPLSNDQYDRLCHTIQSEIHSKSREIESLLSNKRVREISKKELKETIKDLRTIIEKGAALLIANEKLYETDQGKNLAFLLARESITMPQTKKAFFEGFAHGHRLKMVPIVLEPLNKIYNSLEEGRKGEIDFLWSKNAEKIKEISSSGWGNYKELNNKIKSRGLGIMRENQSQAKDGQQGDNKMNGKIDEGIKALSSLTKINEQIIHDAMAKEDSMVQKDTEKVEPRDPKLQYAIDFLDAIIAMEYGDPELDEQIAELKKDQANPAKQPNLESLEKANSEFKQKLQEGFLKSLKGDQAKAQNVINTLEVIQGPQLIPLLNHSTPGRRYLLNHSTAGVGYVMSSDEISDLIKYKISDLIKYKISDLKKYAQAEKIIVRSKDLAEQTAAITMTKLEKELSSEEKRELEGVVKNLKGGSNKGPSLDEIISELNNKVDVRGINDPSFVSSRESLVSDMPIVTEGANKVLINKLESAKERFGKVAAEQIKKSITKDEEKLIRQTLAYDNYKVKIKNGSSETKECMLSEITTPFLSDDGNLKIYDGLRSKESEEAKSQRNKIKNDLEVAFNFILDTNYEGTIGRIQQKEARDRNELLVKIIDKCVDGKEDLRVALSKGQKLDESQRKALAKALSEVVCNGRFDFLQNGDQLAAGSSGGNLWRDTFTREKEMYEKGQKLLKDIFAEDLKAIEQRRLGNSLGVEEGFKKELSEIIDRDQLLPGNSELLDGKGEDRGIEIKESWLVQIWNAVFGKIYHIETQKEKDIKGLNSDIKKAEKEARDNVKLEISKKLDEAKTEQGGLNESDKQLSADVKNTDSTRSNFLSKSNMASKLIKNKSFTQTEEERRVKGGGVVQKV